jgi:geranylgeranylglycerol-phosphate geranylgeranyltransferase
MHSRKLRAYLDLTRPINVVITLLSIPVASMLAGARMMQWREMVLAALTGGLVAAGANSINDYFDVEIDRTNKPTRPIPRGDVSRQEAWTEWLVLSSVAITVNLFLPTSALAIVVVAVVLLYWYSARLKRTIVAGNLVVGLMTGMAFVYGAIVAGNVSRALMPAAFAFLVNVAREIVKDVEDIEGDTKEGAYTLPVRHGIQPALWLASITLIVLITSTLLAYQLKLYTTVYLYVVLVVDIFLLGAIVGMWKDQTPSGMHRISIILKVCMGGGLLAIVLGTPWG